MGQSASTAGLSSVLNRRDGGSGSSLSHRMRVKPTTEICSSTAGAVDRLSCFHLSDDDDDGDFCCRDFTSDLPDECLAHVFQSLGSGDRKRCSLVCRRWLCVEGQSRNRLSLDARSELQLVIPSLFSRFDSVSKLALKCDRRSVSIGDDSLALISLRCPNLTRIKLRACRELTEAGLAEMASNCRGLKKLSCGSCAFGARGINGFLAHASALEELSVKRLHGLTDGAATDPIAPGAAANSLRAICLKELYNGQCFEPLIVGAKNLRTLKLFRCSGDWDRLLELVAPTAVLTEIHLERLQVSDRGLAAISYCPDLEILHLVKTPECTNAGLISIADRCKLLRKLHIDGWKTNRIGDEGLVAVARRCPNLQELVLIGVNPTSLSLGLLASNCRNLERLALCGSDTIGDAEISCIANKCVALRKLCIKGCPVSDHGMEALVGGCPNLVKVKVKKCKGVTFEGAEWLRMNRGSVAVNLDMGAGAGENQDPNGSDGGVHDYDIEQSTLHSAPVDLPSSSGRSAFSKARTGFFSGGRNFVVCTFRRWSHSNSNSHST